MENEWNIIKGIVTHLEREFGAAPDVAVVLGSGLGAVTEGMGERKTVATKTFPNWPRSTVEGHEGALHVGEISGTRALAISGRVHLYEGYTPKEIVRPVRAAVAWGVQTVILTNAAGAIRSSFTPGSVMLIRDHLNLTGQNPLVGPADEIPGPRFPDLTNLWTGELRQQAHRCAEALSISLEEGVYAGLLGPNYETAQEVSMLRTFGADAVGMSTVLEAIAAGHLGARVLGFSTLTNMAAGISGAVLNHDHVQQTGQAAAADLGRLIAAIIAGREE